MEEMILTKGVCKFSALWHCMLLEIGVPQNPIRGGELTSGDPVDLLLLGGMSRGPQI